jgi:hypothetical protein
MANTQRNFVLGRMNKSLDERLVPNGEYIDALNVRLGSTEASDVGSVETAKGNTQLTTLQFNNYPLSDQAKCIGAYEDGANETIYWFVHDPYFARDNSGTPPSEYPTGKIDLIVSYNVNDNIIDYHVISVNDGGDLNTTLNFDLKYLITGVDLVEDLLFFTDNINPPRFINIKRGYTNPAYFAPKVVDYGNEPLLLQEILHVIKRPPLYAPTFNLLTVGNSQDNYLQDRYICFAYRYRYADGEYSATSPFSEPAFAPKDFYFSSSSFLNEGMENFYNAANVSYNTGGPLVESVDLLFKEAQNSTIKVIDKINKKDRGLSDNSTETYLFDNSNIFTVLQDSEILRLYDNVPRFALAQTIMGNRLVYGNYVDGYDLERNGVKTQIEYTTDLISEDVLSRTIQATTEEVQYSIFSRGISNIPTDGAAIFNLTTVKFELKQGAVLTFDISFSHQAFAGPTTPDSQTTNVNVSFVFNLIRDYTSVYDLATSTEFINAVGTFSPRNILPVYSPTGSTSCSGLTFTDTFNCSIPQNLPATSVPTNSVEKYASATLGSDLVGPTAYNNNEPIEYNAQPSGPLGDSIVMYLPYMRFVDDVADGANTTEDVYEFYGITSASCTLQSSSANGSLHSNRGYEVGMVYMDEFGRSSTALVSDNNALHIPCSFSPNKNNIQVNIPTRQIAPEWATNYKFVIKPDEENYDVIYSNIYYRTSDASYAYFLLEGENSQKIEKGDRLIVKKDSDGATSECVYVTVLDKEVYATSALEPNSIAGAYMKIETNSINITQDKDAVIDYGRATVGTKASQSQTATLFYGSNITTTPGDYNRITYGPNAVGLPNSGYPFSIGNPAVNYNVPAGTRVIISLKFKRNQRGGCPPKSMYFDYTMVASQGYSDMYEFFIGENFEQVLNLNSIFSDPATQRCNFMVGKSPYTDPFFQFKQGKQDQLGGDTFSFWWVDGDGGTQGGKLWMSGPPNCNLTTGFIENEISAHFNVIRSGGDIIFESEPQDALPDVWFESADTYTIDSNGYHEGNVQTQTASQPAIVNTDFYNCFSFGNGAESYKIRDSIVGKTFNLGNRVYTTSEQESKEAHRFADLTYSGVYNEESNINKLNEFNLGLLNFKPLERTFGPIQILSGRQTDILTLQEDKISYVLQGKDLLSDAGAGGVLTSVPQVLGKQIARVEDYGISNNPESFIQWGKDKYFTDGKRGAVLQLKGSSAQNEQLNVISEQGMRSWFRDLFIDSLETQKLGGFDPYMNEYVLSSNNTIKPFVTDCIDCGVIVGDVVVDVANPYDFCVDVGDLVGDVTITIDISPIVSPEPFTIEYTYAGVTNTYNSLPIPVSDTITINKNSVADQKVSLVIESFSMNKSYIRGITVGCPEADTITIVPISITSDAENGQYIHSEYSWTDGVFVSPLHSRLVNFGNDNTAEFVISDYSGVQGPQGAGIIPADGATVSIICNKTNFDNFVFNEGTLTPFPPTPNNFRYLRSDTLYDNTVSDIKLLLAETLTNPNGGVPAPIDSTNAPDKYSATFTMPNTGAYLYLIWDYRLSTEDDLCFGATIEDSCCNC